MIRKNSFSQYNLIEFGSLQQDDLNKIQQCRGKHNKLGYAYQLIFVKLLNYFPKLTPFELIEEIVIYASVQLSINYQAIYDYQNNIVKISAHRKDITEYLGLSLFDDIAQTKLRKFIFGEALRLEAHSLLKIQAIIFFKTNNILLPASDTLNRLISFERKQARKHIFEVIHSRLTDDIPKKLNDLLTTQNGYSNLEFLKKPPQKASADAIVNLSERLKIIKDTNVLILIIFQDRINIV